MKKATLAVEKRAQKGKNYARQLRREGKIPAVLYGKGEEPIPLALKHQDLSVALHGPDSRNTLLSLRFAEDNQEVLSLAKEIQFDPVKGNVLHLDFQQIHLGEAIHTQVPIHLVGTSVGVKLGGVLEHLLRELDIECFPMEIPEYIEVDISQLNIGDSIHVSDLKISESIRVLSDPSRTVALVAAPTVEKAPVVEEGAEVAEGAEGEAGAEDSRKEKEE